MTSSISSEVSTTGSEQRVYLEGEEISGGLGSEQINLSSRANTLSNLNQFRADSRFQDIDGEGFSTVIIDTGITLNHPFFGPDSNGDGVADRIVHHQDFANNDMDATDVDGHGTHVSGIVGSSDSTHTGVVPKANIIALKAFTDAGVGTFRYVEKSLQWVIANASTYNIASVNLSLSDGGNYQIGRSSGGIDDELAALNRMGVTVVSAAGNDFYNYNSVPGVGYPASDANSLAVGAVYTATGGALTFPGGARADARVPDAITPFSQRHPYLLSTMSPGAIITNAGKNGRTANYHGTSQASPFISGVAVLAQQLAERELGRRLNIEELSYLLKISGRRIIDGDDEVDNVINTNQEYQRIDVLALGESILQMRANGGRIQGINYYGWSDIMSITEGNLGSSKNVNFYVAREGALDSSSQVRFSFSGLQYLQDFNLVKMINVTSGGTTIGSTFTELADSGVINFAPGEKIKRISLRILGNDVYEPNKTFKLTLSNGTAPSGSGVIFNPEAVVTILNDESVPASEVVHNIATSTTSFNEGNSGVTPVTFTITRTGGLSVSSQVSYSIGGTASLNTDYNNLRGTASPTASSGIVSFAPNEVSRTIILDVLGDTQVEPDETIIVNLSNPTASAGTARTNTSQASSTIVNDDFEIANLEYGVLVSPTSLTEGNSGSQTVTFTITRSGGLGTTGTVEYSLSGTATPGSDYNNLAGTANPTAPSGIVSFGANELSRTITVNVLGDTEIESNETIILDVANPTAVGGSATLVNSRAIATINNDDFPVVGVEHSISTLTPTILEGNRGATLITFVVSRTGNIADTSSVNFSIGGDATYLEDYRQIGGSSGARDINGVIAFNRNQVQKTITLRAIGDLNFEPDENITVNLTNPTAVASSASIGTSNANTLIENDDGPPSLIYGVTNSRASVVERHTGSQLLTFNITRTGTTHLVSDIDFAITGTAEFGTDYHTIGGTSGATGLTGTIRFNARQTRHTITLRVEGDTNFEPDEDITITLSNPTNFPYGTNSFNGSPSFTTTIVNDDHTIIGTRSNDVLTGTPTNNTMIGIGGNDILTGVDGNNRFVYRSLAERLDTITDFTPGKDKIVLTELLRAAGHDGRNTLAEEFVTITSQGRGSLVNVDLDGAAGPAGAQSLVSVTNVSAAQLNLSSNFIF